MTTAAPSVVVLATAWGPTHGGINSFNADMCRALAQTGCALRCVVLQATPEDERAARDQGVELVSINRYADGFSRSNVEEIQAALGRCGDVDLWIGHDVKSGPITDLVRKLANSRAPYAVIHHHHYASYKFGPEADSGDKEQCAALLGADIVFAIGPRLATTARDSVREGGNRAPRVVQLIPGLPNITPLAPPEQFQLLFAGRLGGAAAELKQAHLGVAAFGRAVDSGALGADPRLVLLGVPDSEREQARALLTEYAKRAVPFQALPFDANRESLFNRLRKQSAAMLLSRHEGFGLTAWEAIGAGIPLVISANSGVYQLLKEEHGGSATGCVSMVDVRAGGTSPTEMDIKTVAESIQEIGKHPERKRRDAIELKRQLGCYTWDSLARTMLTELGLAVPARVAQPTADTNPNPLFDVYTPQVATYYANREIDAEIKASISAQHVWVWGISGVGKTSAVRHAVMSTRSYRNISFHACSNLADVLENLSVSLELRPCGGPRTPQSIADDIARAMGAIGGVFHLDELALTDTDLAPFTNIIASVITSLALANSDALLALSTLGDPTPSIDRRHARAVERLTVCHIAPWTRDELVSLIELVDFVLPTPLTGEQRDQLVAMSGGLPRFVKTSLRKASNFPRWSFARVLAETKAEVFR